ncbi:alpha/beta fold hydrolase [Amycolatopsis anabasis]|uniref:alpha/beta fold hydrolase n=1 Tax=Amycolatopsis anabasis TaxID=1840409 RepID=UPI00131B767C|nr:alpha/beta hydrolase [Amycolatopsis anabasis]
MTTLKVPGAELYYEKRGTGPVLLFIPGGNGDAGLYQGVATALADRYTTVTYDRRGFSRSPLDGPVDDDARVEADVEDAKRLLGEFTDRPAYVFGSSSGAIVALELLTRHPDRILRLFAHEPPLVTLLPDSERHLVLLDDVYDTYRTVGFGAALAKFLRATGIEGMGGPGGREPIGDTAEFVARVRHNLEFWLEHELRSYPRVTPDLAALEATADRLVLSGGRDSHDAFPYWPNQILAEKLGLPIVDFPGGHIGYGTHATDFAAQLGEVLAASRT